MGAGEAMAFTITIVQPLHSFHFYWRPALSTPSRSKQGGKWAAWPTARDSSEPGTRTRSPTRRGPSGRGHPDSSSPTGSGWTLIWNKAKLKVWMRPECLVHTLENVLLVHDNVKCIYVSINIFYLASSGVYLVWTWVIALIDRIHREKLL